MDKSKVHRWKIWEDNGVIVGLVFYENPVNDVYFSLRPGYEELADEMVAYADSSMPRVDGYQKFVIFGGQNAIKEAATKAGFRQSSDYMEKIFDFERLLDYPLPAGFHFVESEKLSSEKISECCWKGFDHEAEEGPWDGTPENVEHLYYMLMAPHIHPEDAVVIESDTGEYRRICLLCGNVVDAGKSPCIYGAALYDSEVSKDGTGISGSFGALSQAETLGGNTHDRRWRSVL